MKNSLIIYACLISFIMKDYFISLIVFFTFIILKFLNNSKFRRILINLNKLNNSELKIKEKLEIVYSEKISFLDKWSKDKIKRSKLFLEKRYYQRLNDVENKKQLDRLTLFFLDESKQDNLSIYFIILILSVLKIIIFTMFRYLTKYLDVINFFIVMNLILLILNITISKKYSLILNTFDYTFLEFYDYLITNTPFNSLEKVVTKNKESNPFSLMYQDFINHKVSKININEEQQMIAMKIYKMLYKNSNVENQYITNYYQKIIKKHDYLYNAVSFILLAICLIIILFGVIV